MKVYAISSWDNVCIQLIMEFLRYIVSHGQTLIFLKKGKEFPIWFSETKFYGNA